ncbi:hypothetical protein AALO_G00218300, partial [Alosa alosa]
MPSAFLMNSTISPDLNPTSQSHTSALPGTPDLNPTSQSHTSALPGTTMTSLMPSTDRVSAVTSQPSPTSLTVIDLVFSSNETFTSSLSNQSSPEYQNRVKLTK